MEIADTVSNFIPGGTLCQSLLEVFLQGPETNFLVNESIYEHHGCINSDPTVLLLNRCMKA